MSSNGVSSVSSGGGSSGQTASNVLLTVQPTSTDFSQWMAQLTQPAAATADGSALPPDGTTLPVEPAVDGQLAAGQAGGDAETSTPGAMAPTVDTDMAGDTSSEVDVDVDAMAEQAANAQLDEESADDNDTDAAGNEEISALAAALMAGQPVAENAPAAATSAAANAQPVQAAEGAAAQQAVKTAAMQSAQDTAQSVSQAATTDKAASEAVRAQAAASASESLRTTQATTQASTPVVDASETDVAETSSSQRSGRAVGAQDTLQVRQQGNLEEIAAQRQASNSAQVSESRPQPASSQPQIAATDQVKGMVDAGSGMAVPAASSGDDGNTGRVTAQMQARLDQMNQQAQSRAQTATPQAVDTAVESADKITDSRSSVVAATAAPVVNATVDKPAATTSNAGATAVQQAAASSVSGMMLNGDGSNNAGGQGGQNAGQQNTPAQLLAAHQQQAPQARGDTTASGQTFVNQLQQSTQSAQGDAQSARSDSGNASLLGQSSAPVSSSASAVSTGMSNGGLVNGGAGMNGGAQMASPTQASNVPDGLMQRLQNPAWTNAIGQRATMMAQYGPRTAEIKLDPPELGSLQIRIHLHGQDQVSVSFNAGHSAVRDTLEQQMPRLREMFAQQGLDLQQSNVFSQSSDSQSGRERQDSQSGFSGNYGSVEEAEMHVENIRVPLGAVDYYA